MGKATIFFFKVRYHVRLHRSVGRALKRHRRGGRRFESRLYINFFSGFNFTASYFACVTTMINAVLIFHIFTCVKIAAETILTETYLSRGPSLEFLVGE